MTGLKQRNTTRQEILSAAHEAFVDGALTTFLFVNISVINLYLKEKTSYNNSFVYQFANLYVPLGGAAFMLLLIMMIEPSAVLVGLIWTAVGVGYLLYMTNVFSKPLPQISRRTLPE
ncbi:hypothetical protein [Alkalicoccus luteus]|uniref:hypothetical protein n=1 Tax=Alkalicoccus luteus TaxID=1237094 RepID=UPI004034E808